jgi:hypothetical protein
MEVNPQIKKPRLFSLTLVMLAMLVTSPTLGSIDAFRAYRNQDLKAALTAIGIYLVAAPLIALWWLHRHPASGGGRQGARRVSEFSGSSATTVWGSIAILRVGLGPQRKTCAGGSDLQQSKFHPYPNNFTGRTRD